MASKSTTTTSTSGNTTTTFTKSSSFGGGSSEDSSQAMSSGISLAQMGLKMWMQGENRKQQIAQEQYRNKMRKIQEAHAQNAITVNEIYSATDTKRKNLANEVEYLGARATLAVKSAVSGFSGRTSRAISESALRAKQLKTSTIEEGQDRARRATDLQRLNSAFGTELSLEDGWVQPVNYLGIAMETAENIAKTGAGAG